MKATEATLLQFLKTSPQFVMPIHQRTYSWTERECLQLWDDIMRTGGNEVRLSSADDLPYVLGLVRQSFEKQVGNGEGSE